ncbi:MAG: DNA polymerase III subunit delta [bacterium]
MAIHLIHGDAKSTDSYGIRSRVDELLKGVVREGNFNFASYDLAESSTSFPSVVADALTIPFLGGERTVVVKNMKVIDKIFSRKDDSVDEEPEKDLAGNAQTIVNSAKQLKYFPDKGLLLLVEENDHLDGRTAFYKALKEAGCRIETFKAMWFDPASGDIDNAVNFIMNTATRMGIRIDSKAAERAAILIGSDRGTMIMELEKLALYGAGRSLTARDVETVVTPSYEAGIFHLTDAIGNGKTAEAIEVLSDLLDRGAPPPYILTMIARQVRLIALVREQVAVGKKYDPNILAKELGESPFTIKKVLNQIRRFPKFQYAAALEKLMETDVHLKRGTMPERLALETLITRLIRTA